MSGRRSGNVETFEFDAVKARHVRIVARGRDTQNRSGRFFLTQVRIGDLSEPEAYEPALEYEPGLGEPARRLLPARENWEGGWTRFVMNSDPREKTYLTIKLRGSDNVMSPLYLRDEKGRWVAAPAISMRRTAAYPGQIRYTNTPFLQAAALCDPISLRLAELYLEHGRVFAEGMPRINQIIPRIEAYRTVKELLPTEHRLPMEPDHGDFGWADEDLAVFAARHGDAMISGSFFMDKSGVTPYGRIHFTTPRIDRIITLAVGISRDPDQALPVLRDGTSVITRLDRTAQTSGK